jgi:hypothetical protein
VLVAGCWLLATDVLRAVRCVLSPIMAFCALRALLLASSTVSSLKSFGIFEKRIHLTSQPKELRPKRFKMILAHLDFF